MADFERLDDDGAARVERWRHHQHILFAARVLLAQAAVRSALAQYLDARLDPAHPATPTDRARLLGIRGTAIKAGNRAITGGRLAAARLAALLNVRRDT